MKTTSLQFYEILGDLINETGKNQSSIAKETGISKSLLSQYVNGNKLPNMPNLCKIADYFNVSLDFLAGRSRFREDEARGITIESLGLSEKSVNKLNKMTNNPASKKQLDRLLSSEAFHSMLFTAHSYEKACYALYFVIEADNRNKPISSMTVSDKEIQSVIKVFELSRDNTNEISEYINAAFSSYGVINPAAALKHQLTEELGYILTGIAEHAQKQVEQIVNKELSNSEAT